MDWETLKTECLACRRCGLCETRTNVVFGVGKPDAEVLFIGEGPGANEDEQGLPFVSRRICRASPSSAAQVSCSTICWSSSTSTAARSTSRTW